MEIIQTNQQLETLQSNTMVYAAIVCLVALLIAYIVANIIKYQGGNDKSYVKRRVWFIIIGLVAAAAFFLYNDLAVLPTIRGIAFQSEFMKTNLICLGITLGGYIVLGFVIMFIFKTSKFGSILGLEKK